MTQEGSISRVLRLTPLPYIAKNILDGRLRDVSLADLMREPPTNWVADAETPKAS